ncbi:MAG: hypothetical protein K1Y36_21465 [Blastocatellia bacterium]|nr:hypothetical protein [Blastocatellia bacterium]
MSFINIKQTILGLVMLGTILTLSGCAGSEPARPLVSVVSEPTSAPSPAEPKPQLFSLADFQQQAMLPPGSKNKRRVAHLQPGLEPLIEEILKAVAAHDGPTLKKLVINHDEFCTELWPEFPASKTPNVACDWAWDHDEIRSNIKRETVLRKYGGKKFTLVKIEFKEKPIVYDTFRVLMQPRVTLKDEQGKLEEVRDLCGPIVDCGGRFKLYSYYNGD